MTFISKNRHIKGVSGNGNKFDYISIINTNIKRSIKISK